MSVGQEQVPETNCGDTEKATCSNQVSNCSVLQKSANKKTYAQAWDDCGLIFPGSMLKKMETQLKARFVCEHYINLTKSKQYCGVSNKIWHHSDCDSWVCYDNCDV